MVKKFRIKKIECFETHVETMSTSMTGEFIITDISKFEFVIKYLKQLGQSAYVSLRISYEDEEFPVYHRPEPVKMILRKLKKELKEIQKEDKMDKKLKLEEAKCFEYKLDTLSMTMTKKFPIVGISDFGKIIRDLEKINQYYYIDYYILYKKEHTLTYIGVGKVKKVIKKLKKELKEIEAKN